ncbi:MAG: hypothetical protein QXQ91_00005 [Nanopusillaceae archaeon]
MITEPLFEIVIDDEVVYRVYENGEYVYIDNVEHIYELGFWDFE